jgi:uncharacterized protein YjaZ
MRWSLDTDELKAAFSGSDINLIRESFLRAAKWSNRFLAVDDVNVRFFVAKSLREWWGVGGYAPDAHSICIFTHPDMFRLREGEGQVRFSAVVAHELHHVKRRRGPGYGETLGEMMVSEGLAIKFQLETGHPDFPDERYLTGADLYKMAERAKPLLGCRILDGFISCEDGSIIDHYLVGLHLIEAWSQHTGVTAAAGCDVPAQEVLDRWKNGEFYLNGGMALRPTSSRGCAGARPGAKP